MITALIHATVVDQRQLTPQQTVWIKDDTIQAITSDSHGLERADHIIDVNGAYVAPGFIDLHIHGGGGADFMDADPSKYEVIAQAHARHGMTACLATTLASSMSELQAFLNEETERSRSHNGTKFLGVHLEGPYFAMEQRGAQDPRYIRIPTDAEVDQILASSANILRWSMAPEVEGVLPLAQRLANQGVVVSIAHTAATASEVMASADHGFSLVTHLYSGMNGVTRVAGLRVAGAVEGTFLCDRLTAEIIADGKHLPLELIQLVHRIKTTDKVILTTDAMRAAGTTLTESVLGSLADGQRVIIKDGVAKLPDETSLAGSIATADRLVRTAVAAGIPLAHAVAMVSENPAKLIRRYPELGSLTAGAKADLVVFDDAITVQLTMIDGRIVYRSTTM